MYRTTIMLLILLLKPIQNEIRSVSKSCHSPSSAINITDPKAVYMSKAVILPKCVHAIV